jgi:hypothetical protein
VQSINKNLEELKEQGLYLDQPGEYIANGVRFIYKGEVETRVYKDGSKKKIKTVYRECFLCGKIDKTTNNTYYNVLRGTSSGMCIACGRRHRHDAIPDEGMIGGDGSIYKRLHPFTKDKYATIMCPDCMGWRTVSSTGLRSAGIRESGRCRECAFKYKSKTKFEKLKSQGTVTLDNKTELRWGTLRRRHENNGMQADCYEYKLELEAMCGNCGDVRWTDKDSMLAAIKRWSLGGYCFECATKVAGEENRKWRGGRYDSGDGYITLAVSGLPKKRRDIAHAMGYYRMVVEHRLVMAEHLGRPLLNTEVVHHINLDKHDNRICNLLVLSSSEHQRIHGSVPGTLQMKLALMMAKLELHGIDYDRKIWDLIPLPMMEEAIKCGPKKTQRTSTKNCDTSAQASFESLIATPSPIQSEGAAKLEPVNGERKTELDSTEESSTTTPQESPWPELCGGQIIPDGVTKDRAGTAPSQTECLTESSEKSGQRSMTN